jgi:hypothetical protein
VLLLALVAALLRRAGPCGRPAGESKEGGEGDVAFRIGGAAVDADDIDVEDVLGADGSVPLRRHPHSPHRKMPPNAMSTALTPVADTGARPSEPQDDSDEDAAHFQINSANGSAGGGTLAHTPRFAGDAGNFVIRPSETLQCGTLEAVIARDDQLGGTANGWATFSRRGSFALATYGQPEGTLQHHNHHQQQQQQQQQRSSTRRSGDRTSAKRNINASAPSSSDKEAVVRKAKEAAAAAAARRVEMAERDAAADTAAEQEATRTEKQAAGPSWWSFAKGGVLSLWRNTVSNSAAAVAAPSSSATEPVTRSPPSSATTLPRNAKKTGWV